MTVKTLFVRMVEHVKTGLRHMFVNVLIIMREIIVKQVCISICCNYNWVINVRENQKGDQKWTIQRQWQHWVHMTKTNKQENTTQRI